jgi:hypothetical protein
LAVLRLTTNSYLVGACTGRSAGFETDRAESEIRGGVDDLSGPPAAAFGPTNRSGKTPTLDQTGRITYKRAVCASWSDKLDVPPELIRTSKALNKSPSACSTAPLRGGSDRHALSLPLSTPTRPRPRRPCGRHRRPPPESSLGG